MIKRKKRERHTDGRIGHDDHDIGVRSETLDEGSEVLIPHFHALELCLGLRAGQLELLDDGGDLLEQLHIYLSIKVNNYNRKTNNNNNKRKERET